MATVLGVAGCYPAGCLRAYDADMADEQAPAAPAAADEQQPAGGGRAGILLDVAGVVAGVVLLGILIDVWSGGKLSGRLQRGRPQAAPRPGRPDAGPDGERWGD